MVKIQTGLQRTIKIQTGLQRQLKSRQGYRGRFKKTVKIHRVTEDSWNPGMVRENDWNPGKVTGDGWNPGRVFTKIQLTLTFIYILFVCLQDVNPIAEEYVKLVALQVPHYILLRWDRDIKCTSTVFERNFVSGLLWILKIGRWKCDKRLLCNVFCIIPNQLDHW